jgi:hypothetical protein
LYILTASLIKDVTSIATSLVPGLSTALNVVNTVSNLVPNDSSSGSSATNETGAHSAPNPPMQGVPAITETPYTQIIDQTPISLGTIIAGSTPEKFNPFPNSNFDLNTLSTKEIRLRTFELDPSHVVGHKLVDIPFPEILAGSSLRDTIIQTLLRSYNLGKFNMTFRIESTSTIFDAGRIKLTWVPQNAQVDFANAVSMPGPIWSAQETTPLIMPVTFHLNQPLINFADMNHTDIIHNLNNHIGSLVAHVLAPLSVPRDSVPTARTFSIYMALNEPIFVLPRDTRNNLDTLTFHSQMDQSGSNFNMPDFQYNSKPLLTDSTVYPHAKLMTGDAPTSDLSHITGNALDEMQMSNLVAKPGLIEDFEIPLDSAPGAILKTLRITPMFRRAIGAPITPLAYFTNTCEYWTGSLIYKFQITKTRLTKLRLGFTILGQFDVPLASSAVRATCPTTVAMLADQSEITVTVPYLYPTRVRPTRDVIWNNLIEAAPQLRVYLAGNIIADPTSTSAIHVNVFVCAAPDFKLYFPRFANPVNLLFPFEQQEIKKKILDRRQLTFHSQMENMDSLSESSPLEYMSDSLAVGNMTSTPYPMLPSPLKEVTSLSEIISRVGICPLHAPGPGIHKASISPMGGLNSPITNLVYFTSCFRYWLGSINFLFNTSSNHDQDDTTLSLLYNPRDFDLNTSAAHFNYPGTVVETQHNKITALTVPSITHFDALLTTDFIIGSQNFPENYMAGTLSIHSLGGTQFQGLQHLWMSGGSDFKFGYFIGVNKHHIQKLAEEQLVTRSLDVPTEKLSAFLDSLLHVDVSSSLSSLSLQ